jgi:hypothetical protein
MHSREDTLIGFEHGQRNFAVARSPKMFWEVSGDHNDVPVGDLKGFQAGIRRFLETFE